MNLSTARFALSPAYGLFVAAIFAVSAVGLGAFSARRFFDADGHRGSSSLYISASFGIGAVFFQVAGFAFLSLATNFGFSSPLNFRIMALATTSAGLLCFIIERRRLTEAALQAVRGALGRESEPFAKEYSAVCALICIAAIFAAMLPPVDLDALSYHLPLAVRYAESGLFSPNPSIVFSFLPHFGEILYSFPVAAGSVVGASLVHALFGLFTALALSAAVFRMSGVRAAGALASLIFLSFPIVFWEMRSAYTDLVVSFFVTISWAILFAGPEAPRNRSVFLSGLFAGCAVASKISSGPLAVLLLILAFANASGGLNGKMKASVVFGLACLPVPALWMARSFVYSGNFVFPFAYEALGGSPWNSAVNVEFLKWHLGYGPGKGLVEFVLMPYFLFFRTAGNFGWPSGMPDRELGYLALAFIPIAFVPARAMKHYKKLAFFAAASFIAWFFGSQQLRFLIPLFAALSALIAAKIVYFSNREKDARIALPLLVAAAAAWLLFSQRHVLSDSFHALTGSGGGENYIKVNVDSYPAFKELEKVAGKDSKAGLVLESRSLYSGIDAIWLDPSRQGLLDYNDIKDSGELSKKLRGLGIEYILANSSNFSRLHNIMLKQRNEGIATSDYFLKFFSLYDGLFADSSTKMLWSDGTYSIYELPGARANGF